MFWIALELGGALGSDLASVTYLQGDLGGVKWQFDSHWTSELPGTLLPFQPTGETDNERQVRMVYFQELGGQEGEQVRVIIAWHIR